jgi:hypothetical protein
MSLTYIADQLTIYFGSIFLVTGLIGNGINTFIFSSVDTYRRNPCTFYCLIASINNILYILINLIARITAALYNVDLTDTSIIWCKTRAFFAAFLCPISLTCPCLAIIDQFLVTSPNVNIRRCSNIKCAHRIVLVVIIVWSIHGIFGPLFYNISSLRCISFNASYVTYSTIYVILIVCAIPVSVMSLFGWLTYRNISRTIILVRLRADHQLVRMILTEVILVIISITPYGIDITYRTITSGIPKDIDRQTKESFATTVLTLVTYLYSIVCWNFYEIN